MNRSTVHEALVLSIRPFGETNRDALFLTADLGLVRATVFGGPKSKLRAHVSPYHRGDLYLYRDPVRDSRKVVDFDVASWKPGIRESLARSFAAAAVAETVAMSHGGGGDWEEALELADETLALLSEADDRLVATPFLRFLWNWAELLGTKPDLDHCAACACAHRDDEVVWYSRQEGGTLCKSCAATFRQSGPGIGPGARKWLKAIGEARGESAMRIGLDKDSLAEATRFVEAVVADALEARPKTWTFLQEVR